MKRIVSAYLKWQKRYRGPRLPDGRTTRNWCSEDYADYREDKRISDAFHAGYRAGKRKVKK